MLSYLMWKFNSVIFMPFNSLSYLLCWVLSEKLKCASNKTKPQLPRKSTLHFWPWTLNSQWPFHLEYAYEKPVWFTIVQSREVARVYSALGSFVRKWKSACIIYQIELLIRRRNKETIESERLWCVYQLRYYIEHPSLTAFTCMLHRKCSFILTACKYCALKDLQRRA